MEDTSAGRVLSTKINQSVRQPAKTCRHSMNRNPARIVFRLGSSRDRIAKWPVPLASGRPIRIRCKCRPTLRPVTAYALFQQGTQEEPMPITFACPHCSKQIVTDDAYSGRRCKCPYCQTVFVVPSSPRTSSSAPQRPQHTPVVPTTATQSKSTMPTTPWKGIVDSDTTAPNSNSLSYERIRQYVSPSFLMLTLFFLFLPLIEIRCSVTVNQ